jgi:hypothetical protein
MRIVFDVLAGLIDVCPWREIDTYPFPGVSASVMFDERTSIHVMDITVEHPPTAGDRVCPRSSLLPWGLGERGIPPGLQMPQWSHVSASDYRELFVSRFLDDHAADVSWFESPVFRPKCDPLRFTVALPLRRSCPAMSSLSIPHAWPMLASKRSSIAVLTVNLRPDLQRPPPLDDAPHLSRQVRAAGIGRAYFREPVFDGGHCGGVLAWMTGSIEGVLKGC